jgi:hypothetical protein
LVDGSNSALRFNATGKTGILDIITTNGAEGIATSGNLNVVGTIALNGSTGTSGYVLTSNGASAPTWQANASGLAITDDTTTNATRYLTFTSATTGSVTGADVSSTKLVFNPSTGNLGIGNSSPGAPLDITSDSNAIGVQVRGRSSDSVGILRFVNNTVSAEYFRLEMSSSSSILSTIVSAPMVFRTNNTERMRIDADGNALYAKAVRATITTDNDLSFDMNAASNFKCTPTAGGALTFTNITSGQTGNIILVNGSNYAITAAATTKVSSTCLATISATGTYWLSYYTDGTNVYVANTGALA